MTLHQNSTRVNSLDISYLGWTQTAAIDGVLIIQPPGHSPANVPPVPAMMSSFSSVTRGCDQGLWPGPGDNCLLDRGPDLVSPNSLKTVKLGALCHKSGHSMSNFPIYPNHKLASKASRRPGLTQSNIRDVVNESRIQGNKDIDNIWRFFNSTDFITYVRIWQVLLEPLETC